MSLREKKCVPCEGGSFGLSESEIRILLKQVQNWNLQKNILYKKFKFKDFLEAMRFVNQMAELAEKEGHHPDFKVHYNQVEVSLWTHAINGLSENDFILASKIDGLFDS